MFGISIIGHEGRLSLGIAVERNESDTELPNIAQPSLLMGKSALIPPYVMAKRMGRVTALWLFWVNSVLREGLGNLGIP